MHPPQTEPRDRNALLSGFIDLMAGSLGGCANVLVGQPLDTVKVKMQTFPQLYGNAFRCFTETLTKDGLFRGLYAGTGPALVANVAENSVLFCAYGYCQQSLANLSSLAGNPGHILLTQSSISNLSKVGTMPELNPLGNALAGFLAAFFSSFTLCPTELVKCKLQAARETGQTNLTAAKLTVQIVQSEGIAGLFRGLTSTMAREMPGYFFFFGGYELAKDMLTNGGQRETTLATTITAGGFGGICLWSMIFPFDVCKSKIQVESLRLPMHRVMRDIARQHGIGALYNGLFPTLLRTFPSTGALFVAYEYSKQYMELTADRFDF